MFSSVCSSSRSGVFSLMLVMQLLTNGLLPIEANDLGYYDSPPIHIRLELSIHLTADSGDDLRLSCSDTSLPIAGYPFNWYRNNVTLLSTETITDPRMSIDPENGSLYIADARPEDSAHYKCVLPQRRNEIIVAVTELTVLANHSGQASSDTTTNDVEVFWPVDQRPTEKYSWPQPTTETIIIPTPAPHQSDSPVPEPAELRLPNPDPAQPTNVRVQPTPLDEESNPANREALRMRISWQPPALEDRLQMQLAGFYYRVFWLPPNSDGPLRWSQLTVRDLNTTFVDVTVPNFALYVARIRLAVNRRLVLQEGVVVQQGSGYPREGRPLEAPRGLRRCDADERSDEYAADLAAFCVQWDPLETEDRVQGNLQGYQLYVRRSRRADGADAVERLTTILGAHRTRWDVVVEDEEFAVTEELAVFVLQVAALNGRLEGPRSEVVRIELDGGSVLN